MNQSTTYHPISLRPVLILTSHLWLDLPSGLFLLGTTIKILYIFLTSPVNDKCSAHLILPTLIILTLVWEENKLCNSSLCNEVLFTGSAICKEPQLSGLRVNIHEALLILQFLHNDNYECNASALKYKNSSYHICMRLFGPGFTGILVQKFVDLWWGKSVPDLHLTDQKYLSRSLFGIIWIYLMPELHLNI
jgi:hypothetical protein